MQEWLFVFDSTHHAIAAEHQIKMAAMDGWIIQMIPTPRQITASCGLSLRMTMESGEEHIQELIRLLDHNGIAWTGLYLGDSGGSHWHKAAEPSIETSDEPHK